MKKKLQVFISSTYTDMQKERQAAVEAILDAGHIPAGMELFASGDESQLETIRRWIDDSDVFMLILGGRYGTVEPKSKKSYTQLEYAYATETQKPFFAAVITESHLKEKVMAVGPDAIERDNGNLLKEFREVVTSKTSRFFSNENELKLIVFKSLTDFERNRDLIGWVRGDEVVDPKTTLEEMNRLQKENILLREQVKELIAVTKVPQKSVASALSENARKLLLAAKISEGSMILSRTFSGNKLQVGNENFIQDPMSDREKAQWRAVLDELLVQLLIEEHGAKGGMFRLTQRGYEVGDEIEAATKPDSSPELP
jgi:Domain of unknown function (DUF4062)